MSASGLELRRMSEDDLPLMHEWLQREHVRRWWTGEETYKQVVAQYLPAIDGRDPARLFVVILEERPVGFVQTYLEADEPAWEAIVQAGPGAAGVDLFIAEPDLTGKGLGTALLRIFVRDVVFADASTNACVADPDSENAASIRAFEKAGFRRVREFIDPEDGRTHALMRLDRAPGGE
ncbi:MAG: GNAT family N-acetyltransferase [Gaiellaceae bacterium]